MPRIKQGKNSIIFIVISFVLVIIINIITINQRLPKNDNGRFFDNMPLAIMTLAALASAIISLIAGLIATIKYKDKSLLIFVCILLGVAAIYFAIAQVVGEFLNSY
ncbi:hypothetical protein [Clostridium sp. Cult2]|uniref:hypothetical protein n=1 Tax=Clostridium sp. Cult2 TaxID=2079003 RepID=UPI001F3642D7|nr:hypothetical protein [Clostridium sp. Cult2]MCF6464453.1 hypothetical protein [Clostridium sp. Cult2]